MGVLALDHEPGGKDPEDTKKAGPRVTKRPSARVRVLGFTLSAFCRGTGKESHVLKGYFGFSVENRL